MKTALVIVILLGFLAVAIYAATRMWVEIGPVDMGFHGIFALILMVVLGLAVGIGLMTLVFISHRRGYDQ